MHNSFYTSNIGDICIIIYICVWIGPLYRISHWAPEKPGTALPTIDTPLQSLTDLTTIGPRSAPCEQ
jgi:hypothetical protein